MSLRDKPYLPLYVQDFITDEKLIECSAAATGVYIRLMCAMHKSEHYGKILLKQKDKQTEKQIENFAWKLAKQFPYGFPVILAALEELVSEQVLSIEGDFLVQKRMVADGELSATRALSGSNGGKTTQKKIQNFAKANNQAKQLPNSDNDIVINKEDISKEVSKRIQGLEGNVRVDEVDQELLLYMYGVNDLEPNQTKTKEMYIVQELIKIWKMHYPEDYIDKQKDFSAALDIAYKIADKHGWKKESVLYENLKPCCDYWAKMVITVKQTSWQSDWTICSIKNNFPKVVKQVNNFTKGNFTSTSTTNSTGKSIIHV